MATLYQPPRQPIIPRPVLKGLLVALVLAGAGLYLYQSQPGWVTRLATGLVGLFGYETVTVDVSTTPARADILLDGQRVTSLPIYVRREEADHQLTAIAPGFVPAKVTFRANADRQLILTLKPRRVR